MFLAPKTFFGGGLHEILDQCYKTGPSTDHCAKFLHRSADASQRSRIEKFKKKHLQ